MVRFIDSDKESQNKALSFVLGFVIIFFTGFFAFNDFYIDTYSIEVLKILGAATLILLISIFFHEIGHLIGFIIFKNRFVGFHFKKGRILAGKKQDYEDLNYLQYFYITFMGVLFGLLFIMAIMIGYPVNEWSIITSFAFGYILVGYIYGSWSDIKELWRLRRLIR